MITNLIAWCVWAIAALAAAFIGRNPFLQALLLLVLINVWVPYRRGRSLHLSIGLTLAIVPVLFSVALSRFGNDVIVTLPSVPIIGGAWTWNALLFGASSGAALLLTVAVFGVLQSTVRSADLIALLPRPLYRAGTVFALAIAFVPKTMASLQSIQQARRMRGRQTGWRAVPSILVPLLLTTLEQALQYAESLDARGYGSRRRSRYRPVAMSVFDATVLVASIASLLLIAIAPVPAYNPYIQLAPTAPTPVSILAILLLAVPAILAVAPREAHATHRA